MNKQFNESLKSLRKLYTKAEILDDAENQFPQHQALTIAYEHGQHWITCNDCGAQWSINAAIPGPFSYEQVTDGDEFCEVSNA